VPCKIESHHIPRSFFFMKPWSTQPEVEWSRIVVVAVVLVVIVVVIVVTAAAAVDIDVNTGGMLFNLCNVNALTLLVG